MRIEPPASAPVLLAIQILTRLPVRGTELLPQAQVSQALTKAAAWLPAVGTLIGLFTAAVFAVALHFWPPLVAALIALAAEALLTGAFHEDGVADFWDGFGGGRSADEVKHIMKDSRIGSYGALGLLLSVGLRAAAMAALPPMLAAAAIVGAAANARLAAVALMWLLPPASSGGMGASLGVPTAKTLSTAILFTVPGLAVLGWEAPFVVTAGLACTILFLFALRAYIRWRIGGRTGDCLGFAAYHAQLLFLLVCAAKL